MKNNLEMYAHHASWRMSVGWNFPSAYDPVVPKHLPTAFDFLDDEFAGKMKNGQNKLKINNEIERCDCQKKQVLQSKNKNVLLRQFLKGWVETWKFEFS